MADSIGQGFAIVNSLLAFAGLLMTLYGQRYFKEGLLVKTFRRGAIAAALLFLHFLFITLGEVDVISRSHFIDNVFEFSFTLALAYVTFGLIRDWKSLGVK